MIILWIFLVTGGWTTLESYNTLAECRADQRALARLAEKGNPDARAVINSICLPAGMEPR